MLIILFIDTLMVIVHNLTIYVEYIMANKSKIGRSR